MKLKGVSEKTKTYSDYHLNHFTRVGFTGEHIRGNACLLQEEKLLGESSFPLFSTKAITSTGFDELSLQWFCPMLVIYTMVKYLLPKTASQWSLWSLSSEHYENLISGVIWLPNITFYLIFIPSVCNLSRSPYNLNLVTMASQLKEKISK